MLTRRHTLTTALATLALGAASRASAQDWIGAAQTALAPGGAVETALDTLHHEDRFHGAVLAAIDGRPVLQRPWGMADREGGITNSVTTRFNIASAGKMFTAVAIAQLADAGALSFDDRISQYLPGFRPEFAEQTTIAQLLSHRSGLGSYFAVPGFMEQRPTLRTVSDYMALVARDEVPADYDGGFRYSNSGYAVLGAIIESITGTDYYEHMRRRVFEPAGMSHTGWPLPQEAARDRAFGYTNGCFARPPGQCTPEPWRRVEPADRGSPAGGGASTLGDLNAFAQALKNNRLIRAETFAAMKVGRGAVGAGGPLEDYGFGFGRLTVNGHLTIGHNGGTPGFQTQVDMFDDGPLTLVVLSNHDGGQRPASAALRRAVS